MFGLRPVAVGESPVSVAVIRSVWSGPCSVTVAVPTPPLQAIGPMSVSVWAVSSSAIRPVYPVTVRFCAFLALMVTVNGLPAATARRTLGRRSGRREP